ncbi:DUF2680 domain-containing protein [Selenihalanaerobacter shriftii]|uniref:DUF1104 domain-containing protein n=1 Tax=Selenihalanaerobacter shriftii TaxID=142842 RepID=A0A1T4KEG3_9FIRM|nr:DUF2680 domain-containing protein [Selenihalanaerobacter shriftii]SJZ40767.1 Protein of unknown function [Selenihalanaerobacter shriftii]
MKKVVIGVTVLALVLSLGMVVMAAENNDDSFKKNYELRKDYINQQLKQGLITEEQADYMLDRLDSMKNYYEEYGSNYDSDKRYEFQKNYINQQLKQGLITEKQADYMLERLEARQEYYKQNGNGGYGYRMPCGRSGFGPGMMGPGMMGGYGFGPMMHGPGMMGPGMMRGYGPGMMGPGMMRGRGFGSRGRW